MRIVRTSSLGNRFKDVTVLAVLVSFIAVSNLVYIGTDKGKLNIDFTTNAIQWTLGKAQKNNKSAGIGQASGDSSSKTASIDKAVVEPNDPLFSQQWAFKYTGNLAAWQLVKQKKQIKVAVVDTGVDYNHPDLKNRVLRDLGYDFFNNDNDPMDDSWHGTHVAGIIAAEANNGIGVAGMTGNLDVKIIPVKVLDKDGHGPSSVIAEGIKYAVDKGADIINFSITFKEKDELIEDALKYAKDKGVFVTVAAGNDNSSSDELSPCSDDGAFTVAALNMQLGKASFSNYGKSVQVSAPGAYIMSTVPGGGYEYRDGTSMAAPIVTAAAAILKAENPSLTPKELAHLLTASAVKNPNVSAGQQLGKGIVNVEEALRK